jgi:hypothetical protein
VSARTARGVAALARSMAATRAARTFCIMTAHSAMVRAKSYCKGVAPSPQIIFASSICTNSDVLRKVALANPWRSEFRLARDLPPGVLGPVLFFALARLVAALFAEVMDWPAISAASGVGAG